MEWNIRKRGTFAGVGAIAAALALSACQGGVDENSGDGEISEVTLISIADQASVMRPIQDWYVEQVEERTNGQIEIVTTEPGEICEVADTYNCISDGRGQLMMSGPVYEPSYLAVNTLPEVIFSPGNQAAITAAMFELLQTNDSAQPYLAGINLKDDSTWACGRVVI